MGDTTNQQQPEPCYVVTCPHCGFVTILPPFPMCPRCCGMIVFEIEEAQAEGQT